MKTRVLLIGSGGRIQNNFIPAILCLPDRIKIVGLYSRTPAHRQLVGQRWRIPVVDDLGTFDLSTVDMVVVSVTTAAVPEILRRLQSEAHRLAILVDTPVFDKLGNVPKISLLTKFERVLIGEDYMNFPQFELIRSVVDKGLIGRVTHVNLYHTGFAHHGTALIRSLLNFSCATGTRRIATGGGANIVEFKFGRHARAVITEPYLRTAGHVVVVGTEGTVATIDSDVTADHLKLPVHKLTDVRAGAELRGFRISSPEYDESFLPSHIDALRSMDFDDKTEFNLLKTCGLIRIFESLYEANINTRYGALQGVYDSILGRGARRVSFTRDPFGIGLMGLLRTMA